MKSAERRAYLLDCGKQQAGELLRQISSSVPDPHSVSSQSQWREEKKGWAMETRGERLRCGRQCESNLSVMNAESNQASNMSVISPKTRTMPQAVLHRFTNRTISQFIGLQISQLHYIAFFVKPSPYSCNKNLPTIVR